MAAHDHTRWTPQRKVAVVERLLQGLTIPKEISADYGAGAEELEAWTGNYRVFGLGALKASRLPPIEPLKRDCGFARERARQSV